MYKKASEVEYFPYNSRHNCYLIKNEENEIEQVKYGIQSMKELYFRVLDNNLNIYVVWPGNYRSDLFLVDDLNAFAQAFKIENK